MGILIFFSIFIQFLMRLSMMVGLLGLTKEASIDDLPSSDVCFDGLNDSLKSSKQIADKIHYSRHQIMSILYVHSIGYVSTQFIGGYLAERFGGRWIVGPAVMACGVINFLTVAAVFAPIYVMLLVEFLAGAAAGLIIPSSLVLYSRWYPIKERQKFGGFVYTSLHSGSVGGMILAGLLSHYDWELVLFCSGTMGVLFFIPWALLAHESPLLHPRISLEERNYILKGLDQDPNKPFKFPKRIPWFGIITSGPVWASVVFHTGCIWIMLVSFYHLPTFLMDILHVGVEKSGYISAVPCVVGWISGSLSGLISQRLQNLGVWSHMNAYLICNGIANIGPSICFLIIIVARCELTTNVLMFSIIMFFNAMIYGGSYFNAMDLSLNHTGVIVGIVSTSINFCGLLTMFVVILMIRDQRTLTPWNGLFGLTIVIACVSYIVFAIFGSVEKQPWNSYGVDDSDEDEAKVIADKEGTDEDKYKARIPSLDKQVPQKIPKKNLRTSKFLEKYYI
ncbi:hypothetical protein R5R35_000209 [Gryllus longicercus]|uniref:Major facilitator superfamily (MFS) profile domain-containing protein n=1 Tax=Gryllus longicercus TaxID=2509291 RepID=A0AAN9ZFB7_9ORTH